MKLTKKTLEKMGIYPADSRIKTNRYIIGGLDALIYINKDDDIHSLIIKIHTKGVERGVVEGKRYRSNQIKDLLENDDLPIID